MFRRNLALATAHLPLGAANAERISVNFSQISVASSAVDVAVTNDNAHEEISGFALTSCRVCRRHRLSLLSVTLVKSDRSGSPENLR